MSGEDKNDFFDEQEYYDPRKHKQLLQSISRLGKTQHIQKPSRSEPVLKQDEFHLTKTGKISKVKVKDTAVSVNDLVKILNKTKKHFDVGKELKTTQWTKKVLPKPLEKPVADRLQRTIGYEKAKKKLQKWDAVVAKNRQSDNQVFPLDYEEIHIDTTKFSKKFQPKYSLKSQLQIEMEALEEKVNAMKGIKQENIDEKDEEKRLQQKLTRDELIARRKELAYLRMQQSQKSAKARLHNKIKSKKFHKLLKKEKLKEQLKQFETLQKTNPDAAIEQLEKLEKSRVLERANLRHKNTGTWAKNLQVRAKYDRDVRKELAEQLAISRELTQKQKESSDEDEDSKKSDDEMEGEKSKDENEEIDPFNPWVKVSTKKGKTHATDEVLTGYRKYWIERNENEKAMHEYKEQMDTDDNKIIESLHEDDVKDNIIKCKEILVNQQQIAKEEEPEGKSKNLKTISKGKNVNKSQSSNFEHSLKRKKKHRNTIENGWVVEEINNDNKNDYNHYDNVYSALICKDIDDIFDEAEDITREKLSKKIKNIQGILKGIDETPNKFKSEKTDEKDELKHLKDLTFKNQKQRPDFDEQLNELPASRTSKEILQVPISSSEKEIKSNKTTIEKEMIKNHQENEDLIDPTNFAHYKPRRFHGLANSNKLDYESILNEEVGDENEIDPELTRQMTIAEAFEDDDVIADFTKEKEDKNKKDIEVDLTMPGWGSWAGCGINKQNKKRLILKFPEKEKRRDDNKGSLYINENANGKLKEHLVSDLPFPFTSVKDYEASIRAPMGRSFVPESAFKILTRPAIETKMGHIIQPMNDSILVEKPFVKRKHLVDYRVEKLLDDKSKDTPTK